MRVGEPFSTNSGVDAEHRDTVRPEADRKNSKESDDAHSVAERTRARWGATEREARPGSIEDLGDEPFGIR
jgi:hypothetical protein